MVFELQCTPGEDCGNFGHLSWDADVGPGTSLTLTGRSAGLREALAAERGVVLAEVPDAVPPVDLMQLELDRFLQIDATLRTSGGAPSPVLRSLTVTYHCDCWSGP